MWFIAVFKTMDGTHFEEIYPDFQIMGSSGPLLEKFGGPLLSFGGPANLYSTRLINIR